MSKSTSALLDVFRFLAAMLVFFHHSEHVFHSAWLSPLASFGHDSVVFFFLLSGFVIAHTTKNKDRDLRDYAVARLARIYSVALPSLLLVVVLYVGGSLLRPELYPLLPAWHWLELMVTSSLFLNQSLDPRLSVPTNAAYWSICFEVWYYILFGCLYYLRGFRRIAFLMLGVFFAGLPVLVMFPIWFMGYGLYRFHSRWRLEKKFAVLLALTSLGLYLGMRAGNIDDALYRLYAGWWGGEPWLNGYLGFGKRFLVDYVTALLFAMTLVGIFSLGEALLPWLMRFRTSIRLASSGAFSLYLYHMPLLAFLSILVPSSIVTMLLTLLFIYLLAPATEGRKEPYVRFFQRYLPKKAVG